MITPPERIETDRMILRRAVQTDAEAVFERWTQDTQVTRFLAWEPHETVEETRAFLAHCEAAWNEGTEFVWMLEKMDRRHLAGSIAARPGDHGVSLGYLMARDSWGEGLMTEAVKAVTSWWLKQPTVFRVWATCHVENRGSARVLEKAEFELEGTLRRWDRYPNLGEKPGDSLCFSRIRR